MRSCLPTMLILAAVGCGTPSGQGEDTGEAPVSDVDADGDGFFSASDCDDSNAAIHPGAVETCNGADDDCDGSVDESAVDDSTWYADSDGDGFGNVETTTDACEQPAGFVSNDDDCDDDSAENNPDGTEVCDREDNDCDGATDDADSSLDLSTTGTWYVDGDGDGFGNPASAITGCERPADTILDGTDCNDANATIYPGATEVCGDERVNDCDATPDEATAACFPAWPESVADSDVRFDDEVDGGRAGIAVNSGGDVDGDGKVDLLIGAPFDSTGTTAEGRAFLVRGGFVSGGPMTAADAAYVGDTARGYLGSSVAVALDVDGDELDDVLLGAPGDGDEAEGAAYLYAGPATDVAEGPDATFAPTDGGLAGTSVAGPGDVNGDGVGDLLIGSPLYFDDAYSGRAYLILGPASGDLAAAATLTLSSSAANVGRSLSGAGDTDGDGLSDMLIGAPAASDIASGAGAAFLVLGSSDIADGELDEMAAARIHGTSGGARLGWALASPGDFDGDGLDDLAVGEPSADPVDSNEGRAYVFRGVVSGDLTADDALLTIEGTISGGAAGIALSTAGDLDEDGLDDLLVGAPGAWSSSSGEGRVYLVLGGLSGTVSLDDATGVIGAERTGDGLGAALAAGDTNDDGLTDVIVGSPGSDPVEPNSGSAFVIFGQPPY